MARTVVALYDDFASANAAVRELVDSEFIQDDISLLASDATGEYGRIVAENAGVKSSAAAQGASTVMRIEAPPIGLEALAMVREARGAIDCVLLDLTMPDLPGADVLEELSRARPDIKVIVSSGYARESATQQFAEARPAAFIQKPYRPADLVNLVRSVLEG